VFRIAYAILRNVEDAEDVVQDTFFKLFRSGAWKNIENEQAFLARMAWRLSVSKKPTKHSEVGDELHELASKESSPEKAALETELSRRITLLMEALPERLRRPLALSSIEGITTAQIAIVMDLPEGTVRRLLSEARALLKEKLERMEGCKPRSW
jgi:RNA polymerase sigma-70 factor (ECF subfamily)